MNISLIWTALILLASSVFYSHSASAQESNTGSSLSSKDCYTSGLSRKAQCYSLKRHTSASPKNQNSKEQKNTAFDLGGIIVPSQSITPLEDPLIVLVGGPGQGGSDLAGPLLQFFKKVRNKRNIIFFDIRGTGKSKPMSCQWPKIPPPLTHLPLGDIVSHFQNCLSSANDDVRSFTSMNAVADLEALRIAIGAESINLWGASYGTRLAQLYMRSYPNRVRSAVLDAVVPFQPSYIHTQPKHALVALNRLSEDCRQSPICESTFPNFNALTLLNQFSDHKEIHFQHPVTGIMAKTVTSRAVIAQIVFSNLYQPQSRAFIPWALTQAIEKNQWAPLAALAVDTGEYLGIKSIYEGAHYSVVCSGEYRRNPVQEDFDPEPSQQDPFFNQHGKIMLKTICDQWPVSLIPEVLPKANSATNQIPILMISGTLDPITPPSMAQAIENEFSNNRHIIIKTGGHMNSSRPCVQEAIADFIKEPAAWLEEFDSENICDQEKYIMPFITSTLASSTLTSSTLDNATLDSGTLDTATLDTDSQENTGD